MKLFSLPLNQGTASIARRILAVLGLVLFTAPAANAQVPYYWDNNGITGGFGIAGGTWSSAGTGNLWNTDSTGVASVTPNYVTTTSDPLNFGTGVAGGGLATGTITISGAVSANSFTFGSLSGAITLSGGTSITLDGTTPTITVNNASDTIAAVLVGTAGLTTAGTGNLTLSGLNTYTGNTTVSAGTLTISGTGYIYGATTPVAATTVTVASGAQIVLSGTANNVLGFGSTETWAVTGTINSTGGSAQTIQNVTLNNGTLSGVANASFGTYFVNASPATITANGASNIINAANIGNASTLNLATPLVTDALSVSSVIGVTGNLTGGVTKTGLGTVTLSGANIYTGATTVSAGTLSIQRLDTLKSNTSIASGATFNINIANTQQVANTAGNFTFSGAGLLTITGGANAHPNFSNATPLVKINMAAGGVFDVQIGIAEFGYAHNSMGTNLGSMNIATGASYWSSDASVSVDALTGGGKFDNSYNSNLVTLTVGVSNTANNATYGVVGNTATFSGIIEDRQLVNAVTAVDTAIIKTGTGTQVFSGANTYHGSTTISGGTLRLANQNALQNSTVTMNAGTATLAFDSSVGGHAFTLGGLSAASAGAGFDISLLDNASNAVILTIGGNNATTTYAGVLSGALGSLAKVGTGTLILSGANSYTGATNVSGGILRINGNQNTANGAVGVTAGALGGIGTVGGAVTLSGTGGINLADGAVGTLTLSSLLAITGAAGANSLRFDLGSAAGGTDQISMTGAPSITNNGVVVSFNQIGGTAARINASTYTILQGTSPPTLANYSLATTSSFGNTYSLSVSGSNLQVTTAQVTSVTPAAFWKGGANNWSTAANWNSTVAGGATAAGAPDYQTNVTFATTTPFATNLTTNVVDVDFDINSLSFNAAAGGVTIGGTKMLTIEATTANSNTAGNGINSANTSGTNTISGPIGIASSQTWTVGTAGTLAANGNITDFGGGYGITKAGAGILSLGGANTYTGATTVSTGVLTLTNFNALANSSSISVASGAAIRFSTLIAGTYITSGPISIAGNGNTTGNAANPGALWFGQGGSYTSTLNAPINLTAAAKISSYGNAMNQILGGVISGGVASGTALTIQSQGGGSDVHSWTLNNSSTYAGNTTFTDSAGLTSNTLKLGVANALPTATTLTLAPSVTATITKLDLNGQSQQLAGLLNTGTATSAIVLNSGAGTPILTINNSGGNAFSGLLGTGGTSFALTKTGAGTLTLSAANTYTGNTTLSAGTINLGVAEIAGTSGPLGKSAAANPGSIILSGGTMQYSASNNIDYSGRFSTAASQAYNVDTNGVAVTWGTALISSGGTLTKGGTGTLTLSSNATTYTGATTVNAGTLAIASTGTLANTAITLSNAGSTFAVLPGSGTVSLGNTGTSTAGATLNLGSGTVFSMVDGTAGGTTNLVQGATFGTALTLNTATLNFELSGATADKLAVTGTTSTALVTGTNTINLTPLAALTAGTYGLITTANAAGGLSTGGTFKFAGGQTAAVATFGANNYLVTLNNAANLVSVTVGAAGAVMTWTGQTAGNGATDASWNTTGSTNFAVATTPVAYINGNNVTFQDSNTVTAGNVAAPSLAVVIQASGVTPGSTTFNNTNVDYTVSNASGSIGIAGTGTLTKSGSGTLTLNNVNTYSGGTTISGGRVKIGSAGQLGAGTYAGAITFSNNALLQYSSSAGQSLTGNITGAGGITKDTGVLDLNLSGAANTYTGNTTVSAGRILSSAPAQLSSGATSIVQSGIGQLFLTNSNATFSNPISISGTGYLEPGDSQNNNDGAIRMDGTNTWSGQITLAGNARIGGYGGVNNTISGKITGGFGIEFYGMNSAGSQTQTYTISNTANNYTGNTTITNSNYNSSSNSGSTTTLKLGNSNVIPSGASAGNVVFAINGTNPGNTETLDLNSFSQTINGTTVNYGANGKITNSATGASVLTIGTNTTTSTFTGTINDAGVGKTLGITKTGSGTVTLAGANSYIGATTVSAGTLALASTGFYSGSTTTVGSTGTLLIDTTNNAARTLTNNLVLTGGTVQGAQDNAGSGGTIALIGGNVLHTFVSSGTLTLTSPLAVGNVNALIVGGGGGGGGGISGTVYPYGGGGGQVLNNTTTVAFASGANTITVGASGTAVGNGVGIAGGTSSAGGITANGGVAVSVAGTAGGTSGSGKTGGGKNSTAAGGGGGDSAAGSTAPGITTGGAGGAGSAATAIPSLAGTYYGGGGGGQSSTTQGAGGLGGGGAGGVAGTANTGGGGGGSAAGGSGIVVIQYAYNPIFAGASVTLSGSVDVQSTSILDAVMSGGLLNLQGAMTTSTGTGGISIGSSLGTGGIVQYSTLAKGYAGDTSIGAGATLQAKLLNVMPNGSTAGNLVINGLASGGAPTFDLNGFSQQINGLSGTSAAVLGTVVNNAISTPATLTVGNNNTTASFAGVIANGTSTVLLTKVGSGTQSLSGANTYTGATTVNAGTLKAGIVSVAGVSGAFGNNSAATLANVATASLDITGFDTQIGSITGGGATGGNVTLGANTLTIGGDGTSPAAYAGTISGTGALTKIGTGTLILSGSNSYQGVSTINGGVVQISAANNLGDATQVTNTITLGAATLQSTANTYDLGVNRTIALTGAGTILSDAGTLTVSGAISNAANTLTVTGAGNTTISGIIGSGAGGLTKTGSGTLILSGANTYSGATSIGNGELRIVTGGSLAAGSTVSVTAGTLSGTGIVGGSTTVSTGATIRGDSGTGTGTLTTASIKVNTGGSILATVGDPTPSPTFGLSSNFSLGASAGTLNLITNSKLSLVATAGFNEAASSTYLIASMGAGNGGNLQLNSVGVADLTAFGTFVQGTGPSGSVVIDTTGFGLQTGDTFTLSRSGDNLVLSYAPASVPEPGTILGIAVAGLGLAGWVRRRRGAKV